MHSWRCRRRSADRIDRAGEAVVLHVLVPTVTVPRTDVVGAHVVGFVLCIGNAGDLSFDEGRTRLGEVVGRVGELGEPGGAVAAAFLLDLVKLAVRLCTEQSRRVVARLATPQAAATDLIRARLQVLQEVAPDETPASLPPAKKILAVFSSCAAPIAAPKLWYELSPSTDLPLTWWPGLLGSTSGRSICAVSSQTRS